MTFAAQINTNSPRYNHIVREIHKKLALKRIPFDEEIIEGLHHIKQNGEALAKTRNFTNRVKSMASGYSSTETDGGYIWTTPQGKTLCATFAHNEKRLHKIKEEIKTDIDKRLKLPFSRNYFHSEGDL